MDQLIRSIALTSLLAMLIFASVEARIPGIYTGGPWQNAHATFYGGSDASGTMGVSHIPRVAVSQIISALISCD
jgi:hypothetical protein